MIDRLYGELDEAQVEVFEAHMTTCVRCRSELESLQETREAMRALPEVDPPPALSAILLHEAARAASSKVPRKDGRPGPVRWLVALFVPVAQHPAAVAVVTLVLVAGVAGTLFLRGDHQVARPTTQPASGEAQPSRVAAETAPTRKTEDPLLATGESTPEEQGVTRREYEVRLADEGDTDVSDDGEARGELAAPAPSSTMSANDRPRKRGLQKSEASGKERHTVAAVSGADPLFGLAEDKPAPAPPVLEESVLDQTAGVVVPADRTVGSAPEGATGEPPSAQPREASQKAYRVYRDSPKELAWAKSEARKLSSALSAQRCRDAAKIANDILDRNPDYYYDHVAGQKSIERCQWYVKNEQKRRARSRAQAKPTTATKQAKGAEKSPQKAPPAQADAVE